MDAELKLDRMSVEDVGANPHRLAEAILKQLGPITRAVPIAEIARALDITEIRFEPLTNFEGALITTRDRNTGAILANSRSGLERRRFTVAHELGHFLNAWHKPSTEEGFCCTKQEIQQGFQINNSMTAHDRQEAEANRFAIELLAPRAVVQKALTGEPRIEGLRQLAKRFEVSKSAMARRYVELHPAPITVVFTLNGVVQYPLRNDHCPRYELPNGSQIFSKLRSSAGEIVEHEIILGNGPIWAETLVQEDGYAMTMLTPEEEAEDDEDEDGFSNKNDPRF